MVNIVLILSKRVLELQVKYVALILIHRTKVRVLSNRPIGKRGEVPNIVHPMIKQLLVLLAVFR